MLDQIERELVFALTHLQHIPSRRLLLHLACMLPIPYIGVWLGQAFCQYDVGIAALIVYFKSMTITCLSPTTVELQ